MSTRMQQRRGTAAQWVSTNNGNGPILAAGEIGYESDTNKFKIGDGVNHWIDLPAFLDEASLGGSLGDYVPLTDLAQPLGVATLDESGKLLSSQIPNIDEISQDAINSALTAGNGISKDYDDSANTITIGLSHDVEIAGTLTLSQAPTADLEAATKLYVDNVASGINFHEAVKAATVAPLSATYDNGTNGVGATLVNSGTKAGLEIDGVTLSADDRVLVKDQADAKQNGVYVVSVVGSPLVNWELVRASDADNSPAGEFKPGDFNLVIAGTVNAGYGFVNTAASPITVGTTEITYAPFSAGKTVVAGTGLWETSPGVLAIDNTVATLEDAQTFKNKGISLAENSITGTIAQLNSAITDANIATISGTETLLNKTLTEPTINTATINTATISGATINSGSIDVSSLKLGGIDVATTADLSTHSSDTTNVHGITDTTALATMSYVDAAVGNIDLTEYATLDGIQTLTNKTLTSPTMSISQGSVTNVSSQSAILTTDTKPILLDGYSYAKDPTLIYFVAPNEFALLNENMYLSQVQAGDTITFSFLSNPDNLNGTYTVVDSQFSGSAREITFTNPKYDSKDGYGIVGPYGPAWDNPLPETPSLGSTNTWTITRGSTSLVTISATEISYLDGVTSSIQTQLDAKLESSDLNTLSTDLSGHTSDTTDVHGITDTSLLVTTTGTETLSNKTLTSPTIQVGSITVLASLGTFSDEQGTFAYEVPGTTIYKIYRDDTTGVNAFSVGDTVRLSSPSTPELTAISWTIYEIGLIDNYRNGMIVANPNVGDALFLGVSDITVEKISGSSVTISSTEISYLDGVTSSIQTQIDSKAPLAGPTFTGSSEVEDLTVTGNLTVQGTTTTINAAELEITDPLIYIGTGNSANANDLGIVGHFDNGTYQHTGIVRDATDGKWKLFSGVTTEPSGTIDFTSATYDTLKVGTLEGGAALTGTPTAPTATPLTSTTQIATTEYVQEDNKVAYVSVSGTSLTLSKATHLFSTVHCTNSSAVTVSIPTDASDDWPVGTYVNIRQMGTGQITVVAATPATTTVVATDSQFKTRVQYSELVIEKIAADTWIVVGDTAA